MPLHEVPPAPTLRGIGKNRHFSPPDSASTLGKRRDTILLQDLEIFWEYHRDALNGYKPHSHVPGLMIVVLGGGMPHGVDPLVRNIFRMLSRCNWNSSPPALDPNSLEAFYLAYR